MTGKTETIRELLYGDHDPYKGVEVIRVPKKGPHTWGGRDPIFRDMAREVDPSLIVEVGTWCGASALSMSRWAPDADIVCVDTFTGSPDFWRNPKLRRLLLLHAGFPTFFRQFQCAVVDAGREDYITPMPMPSLHAAELVRGWGFKADMIYLDGCHERHSVSADIHAWWGLLRTGGLMFGHDYTEMYPGVGEAVHAFFGLQGFEVRDPFWIARKGEKA